MFTMKNVIKEKNLKITSPTKQKEHQETGYEEMA